jgi:hypothetical protein
MNSKHENLEERLERIRLVNKELEKKHRIAEADRQDALKCGAQVMLKPTREEDWPIEHGYTNEDYKNDDDNDEESTSEVRKPIISRTGREIIPPADPVYNFLADEIRDGKKKMVVPPPPDRKNQDNKKPRNQNRDKKTGGDLHRSKSQNEGNWRNKERRNYPSDNQEKVQFNRQKSLNEKHNNNNDKNQNFQNPNSPIGDFVERSGNISVSVSRDGEVKSVRLTSAPVIGSGRVAHSRQPNAKPQFYLNMNQQDQEQGFMNQNPNLGFHKNIPPQNQEMKKMPRKIQKSHQHPVANENFIITKSSVQDRLRRTRYENNETAQ